LILVAGATGCAGRVYIIALDFHRITPILSKIYI